MTIGIVGSGAIGTAFARTLSRAGIKTTISNSRDPDSLLPEDGSRSTRLSRSRPPIRMGGRRKADPQCGCRPKPRWLKHSPFNDADGLMDGEHSLTSPIRFRQRNGWLNELFLLVAPHDLLVAPRRLLEFIRTHPVW
jgi:hypothetical protein